MATYKVIQDIEAEDKLVGPLSLRQFIYGCIAALCGYLSFIAISKGFEFFLVVTLPVFAFTAFFAFPWGRDQSTEVWALAKIRFYFKPRRRIWDQSGVRNLVTITVPRRVEKIYTNGLSETEVQSRLTALANTLDSRGWAVKNVNTNLYDPVLTPTLPESDRLVDPSSMPQEVSNVDVTARDDMFEVDNPVAQKFTQMVAESSSTRRQQLINQLKQPAITTAPTTATPSPAAQLPAPAPADYWFLNRPLDLPQPAGSNAVFSDAHVVTPGAEEEPVGAPQAAEPTPAEEVIGEQLKEKRAMGQQAVNMQHLKVIQPLSVQAAQAAAATQAAPVTLPPNPAKMVLTNNLAHNDDLSVAALERIANKQDKQSDEVVISLHNHSS